MMTGKIPGRRSRWPGRSGRSEESAQSGRRAVPAHCIEIMAAFIAVSFLAGCASAPTLREGILSPFENPLFESVRPAFVLPERDLENGIEAVFVEEKFDGGSVIFEVTVVFTDEDHPSGLVDVVYDSYRSSKYKRVMDVETFFMRVDSGAGRISEIDFPGVYGGDQPFNLGPVKHEDAVIEGDAFSFFEETGRPLIYVTTWNHMFRESPVERDLETIVIDEYPIWRGDRPFVETCFR